MLLFGFLLIFSFNDAFAYVDPGTGSMFIQLIIGVIVAFGIALKVFWYKFKEKIFGIKHKESSKTDD